MCLDVLGYAPLHGVHTHCPCSKRLVFRAFIELRATAVLLPCYCRATAVLLSQLPTSNASLPYRTICATCRRQPLYNRGNRPWERVQVAQTAIYSAFGSYRAVRSRCCCSSAQRTRYTNPALVLGFLVRTSCDGSACLSSVISSFKSSPNLLIVTALR